MKVYKLTEKLDIVLNYANDHRDRDISVNELSGYLKLTHPDMFTVNDITGILKQLLRERHLIITIPGFYKITLQGIVFLENGGYAIQRKYNYVKRQYLKMARRSGSQSSSLILWVLAIIGISVAYFLLKYGYDHFNWKLPF